MGDLDVAAVGGLAGGITRPMTPEELGLPPPPEPQTARQPYPLHALPQPMCGYIEWAAHAASVPPEMVALPCVVGLASLIGVTRSLRLRAGWNVFPILWGAVIARSGSRKTPAMSLGLRPVQRVHDRVMEQLQHEREEYERAERAEGVDRPEKPKERRVIVADVTIEALCHRLADSPRGLLVRRDELGAWLAAHSRYRASGASETAGWLELHSAGLLQVDRRGSDPIYVRRAAVSIYGTIQPGEMARLAAEHGEKGLAARFLLAAPDVGPATWHDGMTEPRDDLYGLACGLHGLGFAPGGEPYVLHLSPGARTAWAEWYEESQRRTADAADDLAAAAASKLEEGAARLALVLQLIAQPTATEVSEESMRAGITLARWHAAEAERVLGATHRSEDEQRVDALLGWLRTREDPPNASEIRRSGPRVYRTSGGAEQAIADLEALAAGGYVERVESQGARGPTTVRWRLVTQGR